jgi:hypothetical protein
MGIHQNKLSRGSVTPAPPISLRPGTRLVREWRGVTHTVLIHADGIEWRGQRYRSLSLVARKITGARWSGPRFFGLRQRPPPAMRHAWPRSARSTTRIAACRQIRPQLGSAPRAGGTGNATQYQASVFNFVPTLKSIYLNLDLDAPPCRLG